MLNPERLLRIALVTPILPVPQDVTRGRYIFETATALSRVADVRVFFQLTRYPDPGLLGWRTLLRSKADEPYAIENLDVECFSYPSLRFATRLLNGLTSSQILTPRLERFSPDIVLAYWVYPEGFAALRSARQLGVPCVVGALGSDIHVRSGLVSWLTRRTIVNADRLITVSEAMRQAAIGQYGASPERVATVINGFNTSVFHPRSKEAARAALGVDPTDKLIVYVGRLVETKGLRELITAFRALAGRDRRYRLALVGDGNMRKELAGLAAEGDLENRLIVTGGLLPQEVAEWISASDLLTLPSWSEGYPNVLVEALACGRPVVATDVGGTREIVNASNGLLIPARDADALQAALAAALGREWDGDAIAAAMQRTWDDVAAETLAVCRDAIRSASGATRPGVTAEVK
jgi:teichuronic acid biosynthesis glycosyltransferase TuaC